MTSTRAVEINFPLQGTTANLETSKNIDYIQKYSEIDTVWAALEITFSSGIYGLRLSQKARIIISVSSHSTVDTKIEKLCVS